jgi:hypothetical protein
MNEKNIGWLLYKVTDYAFCCLAAMASIQRTVEY